MNTKTRKKIKRAEAAAAKAQQELDKARYELVRMAERNRELKDRLLRCFGSLSVFEQPHDRTIRCQISYYVDPRERIDLFTDRVIEDMRFKIKSEFAAMMSRKKR
jgi:50S ribosomal subunit-associated GTPase HflX